MERKYFVFVLQNKQLVYYYYCCLINHNFIIFVSLKKKKCKIIKFYTITDNITKYRGLMTE